MNADKRLNKVFEFDTPGGAGLAHDVGRSRLFKELVVLAELVVNIKLNRLEVTVPHILAEHLFVRDFADDLLFEPHIEDLLDVVGRGLRCEHKLVIVVGLPVLDCVHILLLEKCFDKGLLDFLVLFEGEVVVFVRWVQFGQETKRIRFLHVFIRLLYVLDLEFFAVNPFFRIDETASKLVVSESCLGDGTGSHVVDHILDVTAFKLLILHLLGLHIILAG